MLLYQLEDSLVIKIYLQKLVDELLEYGDHHPQKYGRGTLEPKRHDNVPEISPSSGEHSFSTISRFDPDLMVA